MKEQSRALWYSDFSEARESFERNYSRIIRVVRKGEGGAVRCQTTFRQPTPERGYLLQCLRAREKAVVAHANAHQVLAHAAVEMPPDRALDSTFYPDGILKPQKTFMDQDLLPLLL